MVIATKLTKVTPEEKAEREKLFVIPESEKNVKEIKATLKKTRASVLVGISVCAILTVLWILPSGF